MTMTAPATTITGREYLRVSNDDSGRGRSVEEQHADNERAATGRGVVLGEPFEDNSVSASRYTTKARGDFDRLIADLEGGRFGADELWLWEPSRGSRRVSEWLHLIEACEDAGVSIYVVTHGRLYDPANGRDRRSLLEDAVDSEYESSKVSDRTKRAAAASAAAGRPNGRVPWGYVRRYDPMTRRLVAQEPDPITAPLVRELFTRVQGGHSLRSIQKDWSARGIENRSGGPFSSQHLRAMLLTRAYVGERVHNPGSKHGDGSRTLNPTTVVKGTWEPLVDRATFLAVQHILQAPERRTSRPGRGVHLLSLIAVCDVCSGPLSVAYRKPEGEYTCHRSGHVRVSKSELDEVAEAAILGFLAKPTEYAKLLATEDDDAMLAVVRNEVAAIEAEMDELGDQVGSGAMSALLAARAEPAILKRLAEARAREQALATPSRLRGLIEPGPGVEQRWELAPMSTRRETARLLLSHDLLGELRIERRPREAGPRHVPVAQRITWRRVDPGL